MIIDADCHVSSGHISSVAITADELVQQMDQFEIDKSLVWIAPPYSRQLEVENRALYDASRTHSDRLLPFGWANPHLGAAATEATIRRCFEDYGFGGIKFNGAQDDYCIDDPILALPYIEQAAAYSKPIAFHTGTDAYENTHPDRVGRIAATYPEIPILMVHMGGVGKPSLARSAIEVAQSHPNVTLIASETSTRDLIAAIEALGPSRVCYGSDAPFELMDVERARFESVLTRFDADTYAKVMGGNIARLMASSD